MHDETLSRLRHNHDFVSLNPNGERRTLLVLLLTLVTMLIEIAAGAIFNSLALLVDGWHMATHIAAFMITLFAYRYVRRRHKRNFAFGAGKVGVLAGFASSVALAVVALLMVVEAAERLFMPRQIQFDEAAAIAGLGLLVNILCAWLLKDHIHIHTEAFQDYQPHDREGDYLDLSSQETPPLEDVNLKATYLHVLADALTSILAIIALLLGKYYHQAWLDPAMGIISALIISHWAYGLVKETSPILLDESITVRYKAAIQETIENQDDNRIADLHIWPLGPGHFAVILVVVSHNPRPPSYYKELLNQFNLQGGNHYLAHITVEVHPCTDPQCGLEDDAKLYHPDFLLF
jgi:cation diffusion facilitator family transporter